MYIRCYKSPSKIEATLASWYTNKSLAYMIHQTNSIPITPAHIRPIENVSESAIVSIAIFLWPVRVVGEIIAFGVIVPPKPPELETAATGEAFRMALEIPSRPPKDENQAQPDNENSDRVPNHNCLGGI